jgi:hypothetical protein
MYTGCSQIGPINFTCIVTLIQQPCLNKNAEASSAFAKGLSFGFAIMHAMLSRSSSS